MKYILSILILFSISTFADATKKDKRTQEAIKKALENEKKFAEEQKFYQGSEYDLKSKEVNQDSLDSIHILVPENDFDMDDVYD